MYQVAHYGVRKLSVLLFLPLGVTSEHFTNLAFDESDHFRKVTIISTKKYKKTQNKTKNESRQNDIFQQCSLIIICVQFVRIITLPYISFLDNHGW